MRVLLEKMTVVQLVNKLLSFNGTRSVHRSPPLDPILRQLNPIYNLKPHFFKISFNISPVILVTTRSPERFFPFRLSDLNFTYFSPMGAGGRPKIFVEEYK
jgi:hypothetical protein